MSSKRHQRRKACGHKQPHPDQAGAVQQLISLKHNKGDYGLVTYKCPFGNHWHVGHPPRKVRQALAAKAGGGW
jgi:hypothetical protein